MFDVDFTLVCLTVVFVVFFLVSFVLLPLFFLFLFFVRYESLSLSVFWKKKEYLNTPENPRPPDSATKETSHLSKPHSPEQKMNVLSGSISKGLWLSPVCV